MGLATSHMSPTCAIRVVHVPGINYRIARSFRGVKFSQIDYHKDFCEQIFEDWHARLCRIWLHLKLMF